MKEYRIDFKIKNNIILSKIEKLGHTVGSFCREKSLNPTDVRNLINLKKKAIIGSNKFSACVDRISNALKCSPEELFTDSQLECQIKSNKKSILVSEAEIKFCIENNSQEKLFLEDDIFEDQKKSALLKCLDKLTFRESRIIKMRYGLDGNEEYTLEQIANKEQVTRSRISEIEKKALRKLRHPHCMQDMEEFM